MSVKAIFSEPGSGIAFARQGTKMLQRGSCIRKISLTSRNKSRHGRISDSMVTNVVSTPGERCVSLAPERSQGVDVVLSSGFLAFGSHCGFLQAVTDVGLDVRGIMGTSSGALTGSLFAAGYSPEEIAREFSRLPPIERIRLSKKPWKGFFSLDPATQRLRELLPMTFEGLQLEFGVGVVSKKGYEIIDSGSLAEAVVASAAVPILFNPVAIPGNTNTPHIDGGIKTRVGLDAWRERQIRKSGLDNVRPAAVHIVSRSSPFSGSDTVEYRRSDEIAVVFSSKSKSSLWDISKFERQYDTTYEKAMPILRNLSKQIQKPI
jgi:hypothetical protein